jgi:hypothetical protein
MLFLYNVKSVNLKKLLHKQFLYLDPNPYLIGTIFFSHLEADLSNFRMISYSDPYQKFCVSHSVLVALKN